MSDIGPARIAVRAQVKAVAAANCPVAATEVRNSFARSTKSGPNITITVKVKKTVAVRNISNTLGGNWCLAIL
jgi:hypothetical protein